MRPSVIQETVVDHEVAVHARQGLNPIGIPVLTTVWWGGCDCGWRGPDRSTWGSAQSDGWIHAHGGDAA